ARLLPEGFGGGQDDRGLRAGGPELEPSRLLTHLGIPHDVEAEDVAVELQRRLLVADVEDGGGYRGDHGPTLCRSMLRRNGGGGAAAGGGAVLRRGGLSPAVAGGAAPDALQGRQHIGEGDDREDHARGHVTDRGGAPPREGEGEGAQEH